MIDNDGQITTGGAITIFALIFAPLILFISLMKLFFRAPLAAMLGSAFCAALFWIGAVILSAMTVDMHPLGAVALMVFAFFLAAGLCYGLASGENMTRFFGWECNLLYLALSQGGILGRAFYILVQLVPGLLVVAILIGTLLDRSSPPPAQADVVIGWVVLGWLAISQAVVLHFHRTEHPVGQFVTFDGRARTDRVEEDQGETA